MYNPLLRLIYSAPHPPSPGELSAVRLALAVLPYATTLAALLSEAAREREAAPSPQETSPGSALAILAASLELGGFNLLGTGGQAYGLAHTTAVHASVLLASINVWVPLGAALSGDAVKPVTWAACSLVLLGIAVLSSGAGDEAARSAELVGDAAVLIAALCYSAYTLRLGYHMRSLTALPLAAGKTGVLALGCLLWAAVEAALGQESGERSVLWGVPGESPELFGVAWALVLVSALVPGSAATWLQAKGQAGVSAAEAQVVLALTPVVSVLIASQLLGEQISPSAVLAGGLLISASAMSTAADLIEARRRGDVL